MADGLWRFEIVDGTGAIQEEIDGGVSETIGSGVSEKPSKPKTTNDPTFISTFTNKIKEDTIMNAVVSPLNTATGGLISPIYQSAKSIIGGSAIGATLGNLGATIAVMAVQYAVNAIQKRMEDLNAKVNELGNTDNALIRAGSVSKTTYYSANIFGIKKKTNRS